MRVIHFTQGATDPLRQFRATGAHFVPLADGSGDTHVSCLHLEKGGRITAPSITHAAALLIVHGRITITSHLDARIQFSGGTGARTSRRMRSPARASETQARGFWPSERSSI
jgi:hypothetical protein